MCECVMMRWGETGEDEAVYIDVLHWWTYLMT